MREDTTSVVQQYMQNPYLLDGLKFDLRLYVLVLSCEPLKIFLYEEGLVRFATQPFKPFDKTSDKSCYNNLFMHLTNYAINKESNQFRAAKSMEDDSSHKRTLKKVLERLRDKILIASWARSRKSSLKRSSRSSKTWRTTTARASRPTLKVL